MWSLLIPSCPLYVLIYIIVLDYVGDHEIQKIQQELRIVKEVKQKMAREIDDQSKNMI